MRILVTGGTAVLGSRLVPALRARGHDVRILTRQNDVYGGVPGDLLTGEGLDRACRGIDVVIHAASTRDSKQWQHLDVAGTARLAAAARRAKVVHFLYVSILGVDDAPYAYYRAKHSAEVQIRASGVPFTVVRMAQFHEFVEGLVTAVPHVGLGRLAAYPFPTDIQLQPISVSDAASVLAQRAELGASNTVERLAGPEVLEGRDIAETWLRAHGSKASVVRIPAVGPLLQGLADGACLAPGSAWPGETFRAFAARRAEEKTAPEYRLVPRVPSRRKAAQNEGAAAEEASDSKA